jgi:Ricin-type beta-trefoil lectin domain-like
MRCVTSRAARRTVVVCAVVAALLLPAAQARADIGQYGALREQQTGRCLDVPSPFPWSGYDNGDKLQVWSCNYQSQQLWRFQYVRSAGARLLYHIQVARNGKCLDIDAGRIHDNGVRAQQWDCWNGDNQLWYFGASNASGWHQLINVASGKCLDADISGGGIWDGTPVQQWDCNGGPTGNQEWTHA